MRDTFYKGISHSFLTGITLFYPISHSILQLFPIMSWTRHINWLRTNSDILQRAFFFQPANMACRHTVCELAKWLHIIRGEKRNVSICGRPENDWLLWLSKRYDEVGESDLEKRNVYIALHWAYILASFERRSNEMLYIEGGIGEISGLFIGYSPWTFPDRSHIQR